jgi:PEGA domain-containing protein
MRHTLIFALIPLACLAQVQIPDGTEVRLRLDQTITSATADEGQTVEFSVTQDVRAGDTVVIAEGARATGTIIQVVRRRRLGRTGRLEFSIDRVRSVDGAWIPLRYSLQKKEGGSRGLQTGILTAGIGLVFWPAAPFGVLIKGKDVTINKGVVADVFTDENHLLGKAAPLKVVATGDDIRPDRPAPAAGALATVAVNSLPSGSDIELDGMFVGSTPATIRVPEGLHRIAVRNGIDLWQRDMQVTGGSTVSVNAVLGSPSVVARK